MKERENLMYHIRHCSPVKVGCASCPVADEGAEKFTPSTKCSTASLTRQGAISWGDRIGTPFCITYLTLTQKKTITDNAMGAGFRLLELKDC